MQNRSWSRPARLALLWPLAFTLAWAANAQTLPVVPTAPSPTLPSVGADALADALACRIAYPRYSGLMREIRQERKDDFQQPYRQYNEPMMDVYALREPVQAWGNQSDTIVIASNRVMMAVKGTLDAVTASLEHALEESSQSPLSGALDDQHALVIFEATQPGLEGMVLLGCEYRIPDISLLEDPEDAWRKKPVFTAPPESP